MASDTENAEAASEALNAALSGPKRVRDEHGETEQPAIPELIEADRYLASKAAARRPGRGIRFTQLKPPGAV